MADGITITTNARSVAQKLRQLERELNQQQGAFNKVVMRGTAKRLRDRVRRTLDTAGGGTMAPLSELTQERTGRALPFVGLSRRIRFRQRAGGKRFEVYFQQRDPGWGLTQHHTGYSVGATRGKLMAWRTATGGLKVLRERRAFNVPARKIWPSDREVTIELNRGIRDFDKIIERLLR